MQSTLNADQLAAVHCTTGPLMIVAGPGTGKTKTLAAKIIFSLEKKVPPSDIVALTFTRKAATELKERVSQQLPSAKLPFIGTFHQLALELIQQSQPTVQLLNEKERLLLLKELAEEMGIASGEVKKQADLISKYLNGAVEKIHQPTLTLFKQYQRRLQEKKLVDFDICLVECEKLLTANSSLQKPYVFVDEFQDTNPIQYRLIKLLAQPNGHLCVIGDPKQTIYAFRGSVPTIFEWFRRDYPQAKEIFLQTNYRSTPQILTFSHALFAELPPLQPTRSALNEVCLVETMHEYSEADWVTQQIEQLVGGTNLLTGSHTDQTYNFRDIAIIARTHHLLKTAQSQLEKKGLPTQRLGGSLFEQPLIQWLTNLITLVINDEINDQQKVTTLTASPFCLWPVAIFTEKLSSLSAASSLTRLVEQLEKVLHFSAHPKLKPHHHQQLLTLHSLLPKYEGETGIRQFVEEVNFLAEHEYYDSRSERLTLSTIHSAKGLEFPVVFVIGFEENEIPLRTDKNDVDLMEEQRLLYVALTRAKDALYLLHAQERYGQKNRRVSSFQHLFPTRTYQVLQDPAIKKITKKRQVAQQKQLGLF